MHPDRASFIGRLDALKSACDEPLLVNSPDPLHSERAKQLRCGLCVRTFSALEDFIRLRSAVFIQALVPAAIPFANLPDSLRRAATLGALNGLLFQQKHIADDQKVSFLTQELKTLASVADQNYRISRFAFAHGNSNVQQDEIEAMLIAMHVEKPWESLYFMAKRLNLATPNPLRAEYKVLAENRHAAAHTQSFDIPNVDLKNQIDTALSIGLALDVLMSAAVKNLNSCLAKHKKLNELRASTINVYFVSSAKKRNKFRLEQEGAKRVRFTDVTLQAVKAAGLQKVSVNPGVVVFHDGTFRPTEWYCD